MNFSFAVQIYNQGIPYKHGITRENILQFYSLLNKESKFSKYYHEKVSEINQIVQSNVNSAMNICNDYLEDSVDNILSTINDVLKQSAPITNKLESSIKTPIYVGGFKKSDLIIFLMVIFYYLFSRNQIKINALPKPLNINMKGGGSNLTLIKNFELTQKTKNIDTHLVFIISDNDGDEKIMKLSIPEDRIITEIKIYDFFTQEQKTDTYIQDKIIKLYTNGVISRKDPTFIMINNNKYNLSNDMIKLIKQILEQDFNKKECMVYYLLEYDPNYKNLGIILDNNELSTQLCVDLLYHVILMIVYLFHTYGFSHMDLHSSNLLVDNNAQFKFFDFDISMTENIKNATLLEIANITEPEDKFYRISYDFYRFISSFAETDLVLDDILEYINDNKQDLQKKYPLINEIKSIISEYNTQITDTSNLSFNAINLLTSSYEMINTVKEYYGDLIPQTGGSIEGLYHDYIKRKNKYFKLIKSIFEL